MGTVQRAIGGTKRPLAFSPDRCRTCRLCEERCPMGLEIVRDCLTEQLTDPDCIRCSECAAACPTGALSWARKDATPLPHAGPFRSRRAG
jgi:Fe-S-cluster-containing hydrogenase component 2